MESRLPARRTVLAGRLGSSAFVCIGWFVVCGVSPVLGSGSGVSGACQPK